MNYRALVKHNGKLTQKQEAGPEVYRRFWRSVFGWGVGRGMPAVITLNYDLVLERSLFQLLINTIYSVSNKFPYSGITVRYFFESKPDESFAVHYSDFTGADRDIPGTYLRLVADGEERQGFANVEILKLHGSLNFSRPRSRPEELTLTEALDDPYIVPPIVNKLTDNTPRKMWGTALDRLRRAKNVVIVGYSLPATDVYMQYFIKTAVGPNLDLNRVYLFNPALTEGSPRSQEMVDRYLSCFAPQMRSRIGFLPPPRPVPVTTTTTYSPANLGTFEHFVEELEKRPQSILF